MSVIKAFRQESKIQFIDTARELVVHTLTYCKKFPKSAMFLMTKDIADLAKNIYIQVVSANVIFPNSKTDIEERKKHFDQALGYIDALDCDVFDITNQNRQIGSEFIGEQKANVFERLFKVAHAINLRLDETSINALDLASYDVVIDAIDDIKAKILLAIKCAENKKPYFLSSLGAAKRIDARKIRVCSIWETKDDPFARKIRYELRKADFKGEYTVVCSSEAPRCTKLGSFMGVTASFGLMLASLSVQNILK